MTPPHDLLLRLDRQNVKLRVDQGTLKCRAAPGVMTDELRQTIREHKSELIRMLLHRQDAREALPATEPSHATAAGDERTHAPYVTPCERCHGTRWGPVAPAVTETLRTGDEVLTEVWGCLACEARPEGTPAPPVPETMSVPPASVDSPCGECGTLMEETQSEGPAESRWQCPACGWSIICPARPEGKPAPPVPEPLTTPPWATPNPCPKCDKAYRLFVPGSPHIPGEPERDVLICSQCGHAELACRDCKGTHIVVDSKGLYCVGCRKRPGEPDPPRPSRTEPAPSPPSRHHLGEPAPPFPCPACNHQGWIEGIYSWRCRQCQHIAMKPEGPWPERI